MHANPTEASFTEVYRCPRTRQPLRIGELEAVTADGVVKYGVTDGCPCFLRSTHDEDESELGPVRRALQRSREIGWRRAVDEVWTPGSPNHRYITEPGRTAYLDLLPLGPASRVLEIGCSMGQQTEAIAARCASVHGLDVIGEQCLFALERCGQQGLSNVHVACGGDDGHLPFADGVFDVVVLNLVLEWCASRSGEAHEVVHRRLLSEIHRVLRPGGCAFINTKNRYALRLLMGGPDEHSGGIRGGAALPRRLLEWRLRSRGLDRPRGWLHSYRELRGLLESVGFSKLRSYWTAPEMRYPKRYVPTDTASIREARRTLGASLGSSRLQRLVFSALPASAIKYVTPGLCVVSEK